MKRRSRFAAAFLAATLYGSIPAHAEYDTLLNNIHSLAEQNAKARARSQGRLVSNLVTGFIEVLVNAAPFSGRTGTAASVSLSRFPEYAGTAIGNAWQNYAEKELSRQAREEVTAREPEIRARYDSNRERRAVEANYAAKQRAIQERRAKTYGPPKPNAFY
ncbi:MAG: hypothetical protein RIB53_17230 [Roseitalea porphyridii]|jgi:hypothetical protein|uniref:hypothetical protein n=1 Tax=Roseitalea porphyridii TaxID=1852022 RepID=UPI0032EBC4D1